jgi:NitT/TauT family transport system substrate-binding protein
MRKIVLLTMLDVMSAPQHFSYAALARRQWLASCSLWAACMVLAPGQVRAVGDKFHLSLALDDKASLSHLPLLLAEQLGFFANEGLELEWVEQPSQSQAMAGLTHGSIDVLCAPYESALLLQHRGFDAVSIVQMARTPQWVLGVSNKHVPKLKTLASLRGKRIGLIDSEGSAHRCLSLMLLRSGMQANEVNCVYLNSSVHALVAMREGSIDALFASDPLMTALEKKDDVTVLQNFRTLKQTQRVFGGLLPGNGLIVSRALVEKNPKVIQSLVAALMRSLKWLRTAGPSDLLQHLVDNPVIPDRLVYLNAVENLRESFSRDGWLSAEAQQVSIRMLEVLDPAYSSRSVAWQSTSRNDFVKNAKERFRM